MNQDNILLMKFEKGKNDSKVIINYFVPETNRNRTEEVTEPPHGDFFAALSALSPFLAKVFYASEDKENLYSATGFKFSSTEKIIITGKVATESGSIVGIATPAINIEEDIYGFEDDLNEAVSTMVVETYELLVGKKVGIKQLTIDDSIKSNEEDDSKEDYTDGEEQKMDDNEPPQTDEFVLPE